MKNIKIFGLCFKVLWSIFLVITIYTFGWLIFGAYIFSREGIFDKILVIGNITTIILLLIYTKELFYTYNPTSKGKNFKSLIFMSLLIFFLFTIQFSLFKYMIDNSELKDYLIIISFIAVIASYIGLISNRIIKNITFEKN